jgi:hypothetical protein
MSSIIPERPKRARRPVMWKSVTTSTCVAPPCSRRVETIVAEAPPCPRRSVPRALIVAVRAGSSTDSSRIWPA